jgi:hypothetical protein
MRDRLIELFYENNVHCDQKIEGLVDDMMDIAANGVTVQTMIELKPCPFCGGEDIRRAFSVRDYEVWCSQCFARISRETITRNRTLAKTRRELEPLVVDAWNRRADNGKT